jgi:putative transposase
MSPRRARIAPAGHWYHVGNRAVDRRQIFHKDADYEYFLTVLDEARCRYPVRCAAYTPMPNHFHLVLQPATDVALSAYMRHVQSRYACDLRASTQTRGGGHVYQDRYWNFAIRDEKHFLCVMRYVEGNPLRARLVGKAEDWQWSSLWERVNGGRSLLDAAPVALPTRWPELVNAGCSAEELKDLRRPSPRGRPRKERKKGDSPLFPHPSR